MLGPKLQTGAHLNKSRVSQPQGGETSRVRQSDVHLVGVSWREIWWSAVQEAGIWPGHENWRPIIG